MLIKGLYQIWIGIFLPTAWYGFMLFLSTTNVTDDYGGGVLMISTLPIIVLASIAFIANGIFIGYKTYYKDVGVHKYQYIVSSLIGIALIVLYIIGIIDVFRT